MIKINMHFMVLALTILSSLKTIPSMAMEKADIAFRAEDAYKEQVEIEKRLIAAQNGVFILFTPTHGTPQMISQKGEVPEGLIPKSKMQRFETSVKPRVKTTHQLPNANIRCVYIRYQAHRGHAEDESKIVDETYYKQLLDKYPRHILEKIISPDIYHFHVDKGVPAAFYYYIVDEKPHYAAVFGQQINAKVGTALSDFTIYHNREQDLKSMDAMLKDIGLQSVERMR